MNNLTEMLKGVLEGCVLQIINKEEIYGYEITKKINSLGFVDVVDGTIYTILLRLEKKELIVGTKKKSEIGPVRKFYKLTDLGSRELQMFWDKWEFICDKLDELKEDNDILWKSNRSRFE